MNIPNILTLIRLLLIPVFIYTFYFYNSYHYLIPTCIFIFAGLTDIFDGFIARKYNLITKWGELMDPLTDKILQLSVLFVLTDKRLIPLWVIIVIAVKELILIIGSSILFTKQIATQAKWYGKGATILFYISIVFVIFIGGLVGTYAIITTVAMSLYAAASYAAYYFNIRKTI